jgi:LPXTG-motif cell wall-anchored protein
MSNQGGLGGNVSALTGTVTGVGGGAMVLPQILPQTGGEIATTALVLVSLATMAMLVSMGTAKLFR